MAQKSDEPLQFFWHILGSAMDATCRIAVATRAELWQVCQHAPTPFGAIHQSRAQRGDQRVAFG
eukprot:4821606-Lingulodinium_polyedra.AAC.1